jgi:uncharacterized membrane protein
MMLPEVWSLGSIGWFGFLPILIVPLALIGIVAAIIFVLRPSAKQKPAVAGGDLPMEDEALSPREILKIRYVCGEINREQYYQMLEDLS